MFLPRRSWPRLEGPAAGIWAYEALRIEAGAPRFGLDTDERAIPNELGWLGVGVHLNKGCYRGQETVARVHNLGRPPRRLVRLHLDGSVDHLPAHGYAVRAGDKQVGFIGSAARHHELGPIALALVKRNVDADAVLEIVRRPRISRRSPRRRSSWSTPRPACTSAPGCEPIHSQYRILHLYSSAVTEPVILADVVRSGFVEGHHRGSVVVTNPDGAVEWSAGMVDQPMFPRSSNKPMQALGMLRNGLTLDGKLLALAGASHSGEQFHLDGVREILALARPGRVGAPDAAGVPAGRRGPGRLGPRGARSGADHDELLRQARRDDPDLRGSTAGRSTTTASPDHPLQQAIRTAIEDSAGEKVSYVAVDGCGAPILAISLAGLARSFGLFAAAAPGTLEARVTNAFRAYPEYASGSTRDEAALMRAIRRACSARRAPRACTPWVSPTAVGSR